MAVGCLVAGTAAAAQVPPAPAPTATAAAPGETIGFAADAVAFDNSTNVISASGNVELDREGARLRADQVTWNRSSGQVTATGNVILTTAEGNTVYGDTVELTDSLRDGIVDNLLVVLDSGGRIAARRGTRLANGDITLERAAYSPCAIEDANGCPRDPSWQVRAARVYYDKAGDRIRYSGARLELFGVALLPLPGLSNPASGRSGNGLLVPDIRLDRVNGIELAVPYYQQLNRSLDVTLTPHIYSNAAPLLEGEVRGLTGSGAYKVRALGTYSRLVPISGGSSVPSREFRGYLEGTGGYQFNPRWNLSVSGRITTDRTFLRRYDVSRDDRLRSTFALTRNGGASYLTIAGWGVQTLRTGDRQGQQAIALPAIDFRVRLPDPLIGGRLLLQANTLALTRTDGQDTQRLFTSAEWELRRLTAGGQEIRLTALARGDVYHNQSAGLTPIASYRGRNGWQSRAFAGGAVDVSWPLIGAFAGGTQRLTPRVQIAATSPVDNIDIANEDSRAFELDDLNIFALNRFPGYDRFEDGARITYGADWAFNRPGLAITTSVAQSYRLSNKPSLFAEGTGLTRRASDIVGRTGVALGSVIRLTHRFRLDKDDLAIRRNEFDATFGSRRNYILIGYARLNRDIANIGEDLRDREEVRVGGRVQVANYWSLFGSAIVDLSDRAEDPQLVSDGFTPIRHRLGIAYDDDCLSIGLTWKRDYLDTGDARSGNTYLLRLAFRNLGV